uniref:Protein sel-1 homolog 3-like n=1 Tax=Seriola dumerili TaxID=41447 RepID=A0A3B4VE07_SERDU
MLYVGGSECVLQASSSQSAESLHDNFIGFDSAPDKVVDGSAVRVRYQCSRPCQLAVEVVASTLRKTDLLVFRRKWISSTPRVLRIHQVLLRLPPSILYQHDFFNRNDLEAENVTVRAWLHHLKDIRQPGTYHGSMLKIYKVLQVTPPSQRPTKPHTECPSWSAYLVWQVSRDRLSQCPHESDVIDVLKFPLASTGEHFGVVRRFQPFMDGGLERVRLHAVTHVALSVWIYLLERCHRKLCGIIHHLDRKNAFGSVLMQLTDTGGSQQFQDSIYYDDTDGYFVIGGSKYMPGIHGYYGPIKYHRLGTEEVKFLLSNKTQVRHRCLDLLLTALFKEAVATMFPVDQEQIKITSQSMSLLQVSSCFGNHKASLLLASVLLSGLGHTVDQQQAHVYSLIGASGDDRFALMHAGYKHTQGIDGFPKDLDMAYSYYSNAGQRCFCLSFLQQYTPEHIYLSNQKDLNSLTHESSDVFQYLKLQAERGDAESQRRLGLMLYWGQNGVSKDIESALKWFERSAMQMKDPSAMYDYSILLMKGEGVKRNFTRGFQLLKKAAAMGSINALNGLGWYHGIVLNDHRNAVKYFEQAALNGSDDGMFNLGVYHLSGKNPHNPQRNEMAAFQQFLNASRFGHVAASVEAAWYLSTGSLKGVSQDVERAVIMLKKVCEQNGHLGFMIREALQAYLQGSWQEAFVKYVLAAETGLGLAQSNAAHLCEELNLSYDCQWRYHNYSILNYDPHQSALLKMGDYYYYSSSTQEDSLSLVGQAVSMYSRAALAGSPQVTDLLGL